MWQDPTDVTRRKPRRLRGTPANKTANIVSTVFIGSFCSFWYWFTTSELEWIQRFKERLLEKVRPREHEEIRRQVFSDGIYGSIVTQANERLMDKEYAKQDAGEQ